MKEILRLTKVFVISSFSISVIKHRMLKQKKELWKPIVILLALISFIPAYILYIEFIENVYIQLFTLGQEASLFTFAVIACSFMILFFGIIYAMSSFYFSKDVEQLLHFPIKENKIIIAKFLSMMIYEYFIIIPILIPVFIIPFVDMGNMFYIINCIATVLFLPIIPLGLATVIVILLMNYTNIKGKKDLLRSIMLFLLIFVIVGLQLLINNTISNIAPNEQAQLISKLLSDNDGLVNFIGRSYPPAVWFSKALYLSNSINGILYLCINIISSLVVLYFVGVVSSKMYMNTVFNKNDVIKKTKKLNIEKEITVKSSYVSIFLNDFRLVVRTPIFLFNCISIAFILPILLVLMPMLSGANESINFQELYLGFGDSFSLVLVALFMFIAAVNPTASTTFSREGKAFWITGVMPISKLNVFVGRMLLPMFIQFASIVFMLSALKITLSMNMIELFFTGIIGMLASIPIIGIGITIDAFNPKLEWDEPQKAVKQNINVILNMLAGIGYVALLGLLFFKLIENNISVSFMNILLLVISTILTILIYLLYKKIYNK
ncbi:MAG: putative ABC transporter permease subunit [Eubacteriaceae bacterium]